MKKIRNIIIILWIALNVVSISACNNREDKLIKKGNQVITKIEIYKKQNGVLPTSLSNIGIKEKEEGPLYYQKKDSIIYIVWFGTSEGESKTYYSDTKKWEDHQR